RLREVALLAEGLRHSTHQRELIRSAAPALEIPARCLRATHLRERDRHVLDRLAAEPQSRLLLRRQLVVRVYEAAENVDRLLVVRLVYLIRLVVVRPAELVEREEVDVARRLRRCHRLLVGGRRRRKTDATRFAALARRQLEARIAETEVRFAAEP